MERIHVYCEISPVCNLQCPHCAVEKRLRAKQRREDSNLVEKIIGHVPLKSQINFIGLGEPTTSEGQRRISKILSARKDIYGFIQTNGTFLLNPELAKLVEEERLEVGLSADTHHLNGGLKQVRIQPKYVSSVSCAIDDGKRIFDLRKLGPSMNRVLLNPLTVDDEIVPGWEHMEEMCVRYQRVLGNRVSVHTELPLPIRHDSKRNEKYFEDAEISLVETEHEGWLLSRKHGFLVRSYDEDRLYKRILIDGKVINQCKDTEGSWGNVDKISKPIEEVFPKVYDA